VRKDDGELRAGKVVEWKNCCYAPPSLRYFSSRALIALRELATLETLSLPSAYSF